MKRAFLLGLTGLMLFLASCKGEYQSVLTGSDYELKEKKAREYFAKKKWGRALPLFDEVLNINIGNSKAEDMTYHIAYCYYGMRDYLLANYYFTLYAGSFPKNARAEEAMYMAAYCHYMESPRVSLDQTSTEDAIQELQNFVNTYPESERVAKCTQLIEELLAKLELKTYKKAILYYNLEYYNSCITTFKNLMIEFPDTKRRPEAAYMIVKCSYLYAINTVKKKQKERLEQVIAYYKEDSTKFAGSDYEADATDYKNKAAALLKGIAEKEAKIKAEQEALKAKEEEKKKKKEEKARLKNEEKTNPE